MNDKTMLLDWTHDDLRRDPDLVVERGHLDLPHFGLGLDVEVFVEAGDSSNDIPVDGVRLTVRLGNDEHVGDGLDFDDALEEVAYSMHATESALHTMRHALYAARARAQRAERKRQAAT